MPTDKEAQFEIAYVLFMDVVGYSKLLIDDQARIQQQLNEIVRSTEQFREAEAADKLLRLPVGDGMALVFFNNPEAPARCALEISKSSQDYPHLKLRMGIHGGPVNVVKDVNDRKNLAGTGINFAQRVMACADAGHILLSKRIADDLAQDSRWLPHLHELGEVEVKHGRTIVLVNLFTGELGNPDIPLIFKRAVPSQRCDEGLIGREQELSLITHLITRRDVRLVTLTGIGGSGKTRLALQLISDLKLHFTDGVFFVRLAPLSDPDLLLSAVAKNVGVQEEGDASIIELLAAHFANKRVLLILDSFEHLMGAVPVVADLVSTFVESKMLVTSRERLHLSMENEFSVMPLKLPTLPAASFKDISKSAAVALFVARARAVRPEFLLSEENTKTVAEICIKLDGLPLAIELAAARVRLLTPEALLARLENRLKILTGGPRDLPRQQTMGAAISWSYDLLNVHEKSLLQQLSVFSGGCSLEAAEAICDVSNGHEADLLNNITSLGEKSLLFSEQAVEESRFRMLQIVREFAAERLSLNGTVNTIKRRHGEYFLQLAEEAEKEMLGPEAGTWIKRLEREHDNLRAAMEWALHDESDVALRMTSSAWRFWLTRGYVTEGRKWLKRALESRRQSSESRAKSLLGAGTLAMFQGDHVIAEELLTESWHTSRSIGAQHVVGRCCNALGVLAACTNDYNGARRWYQQGLQIARESEDEVLLAMLFNNMGEIAETEGDYASARSLYEKAVERLKRGNQMNLAFALSNLGAVAYQQSDFAGARACYTQALAKAREFGSKKAISDCLDGFAALGVTNGVLQISARLCGAADALRESAGIQQEPYERKRREQYITKLRESLSEAAILEARAAGRMMSLDEAIALGKFCLTADENTANSANGPPTQLRSL